MHLILAARRQFRIFDGLHHFLENLHHRVVHSLELGQKRGLRGCPARDGIGEPRCEQPAPLVPAQFQFGKVSVRDPAHYTFPSGGNA